jgi:HD-like signal output (HDOD) protein
MDGVFGELERHPEASLLAVERQLLGLDHAVAGAELASAWKLPSALAAAMGPAGEPSGRDELTTLVSLVLLCRCINRVLDDGDDIGQDPELDRTLTALDIRFDGWPALLSEWRERTENIEGLAAAFAGPGR